jgi:hypothetical protein
MSDLHACKKCGAQFDLDQVLFDDADQDDDQEATQFGVLGGSCPECGEPVDVSLKDIQDLLLRGTKQI